MSGSGYVDVILSHSLLDRGLFDALIPATNPLDFSHFPCLEELDISYITRVTYTACHKLLKAKKPPKLVHTSTPLFLSMDKVSEKIAIISEDKKEVVFKESDHAHMIRANSVIPIEEIPVFYFEIEVLDEGHDGSIGIGIASRGHSLQGLFCVFIYVSTFTLSSN